MPERMRDEPRDIEALERKLHDLQFISDSLPALISYVDRDFRYRMCNQAYTTWFGLSKDEILGRTMAEVLGETVWSNLRPHFEKALAGETQDFEVEAAYRLGRKRWVHASYQPHRSAAGDIEGVVVLVTDITPQKRADDAIRESEERFRNMSNHSPMMLWVTDADGHCVHLNDRWFEFTGQTPENGLGFGWLQAVHPEDQESSERAFLAALAAKSSFRIEYRLRRHDGVYRWALDAASPRFATSGMFLGHIGSVIDIQERKEAEDALREAKVQAEQASQAKDNFLAQLSHELRTPLTPVLMTATALRDDPSVPDAIREDLAMIERNIALEARLIDDLLDLTRVTRGKLALRRAPCDAHALIGHVVEMLRDETREKRLTVTFEFHAEETTLNADAARLQQVFWNLLRNAVKFTPAGGRVLVRSHNFPASDTSDTDRHLVVEVIDNGIGFAPHLHDSLFEPFQRAVPSHDHRYPGLGLGLAIARAIVDLHSGTIGGESSGPGAGATFRVELPVLAHSARTAALPVRRAAAPVNATRVQPMRLLLVEDDHVTLQVLTRLLTREGHEVTTATSVAGARAAAARHPFDAVVSDVGLPDGSGVDLMAFLFETYSLQGIALSGYGMEEDIHKSAQAGFSAHLVKPIDIHELHLALGRLAQ